MLEFSRVWKGYRPFKKIYFYLFFLNLKLSPSLFGCNLLLNVVGGEEAVQIILFGVASF